MLRPRPRLMGRALGKAGRPKGKPARPPRPGYGNTVFRGSHGGAINEDYPGLDPGMGPDDMGYAGGPGGLRAPLLQGPPDPADLVQLPQMQEQQEVSKRMELARMMAQGQRHPGSNVVSEDDARAQMLARMQDFQNDPNAMIPEEAQKRAAMAAPMMAAARQRTSPPGSGPLAALQKLYSNQRTGRGGRKPRIKWPFDGGVR